MEALLLVIQLSADHIIEVITVLSGLITEVVEHLLGAEVLTSDLLGVHEALADGKELMLAHLDHLRQFAFLLIEPSVLLLLLAKLGCGIEEELEVL